MVLVASKKHPRLNSPLRESDVYSEQHAVVALDRYASFSLPWYDSVDKQASVAYQGMAMVSVLNVVSQTQLVAIAPRWLAEEFSDPLNLQILPLPLKLNSRTCYLSWHEAAGRDKGHQWMEELLIREGANKQVISSQADSLIKISRIWADFFPANTSNQPI